MEGSSGIKREGNKRERKGGVEGRIREREEEKERRKGGLERGPCCLPWRGRDEEGERETEREGEQEGNGRGWLLPFLVATLNERSSLCWKWC